MNASLQQASSALQRGNLGRAGTLLEQLRLTATSDPKMWLLSASYHHQTGDRTSAIQDLRTASAMALDDAQTRQQILLAYMNLQAWDQAMALLQQIDPQQRQHPLEYARCLWGLGDYERSLDRWQHYARALPEVAEVQYRLWQCLERLGMTAAADQQRGTCQAWIGQHVGISMMEVAHLVAAQQYAEGWNLLQHGFAHHGEEAQPLTNAAVCLGAWPDAAESQPATLDTRRMRDQLNHNGEALLSGQRWLWQQRPQHVHGNSTRMLQAAIAAVPAELLGSGLVLEFGVFHGRSLRIIATAPAIQAQGCHVHGFDSFAGLPEDWNHEAAGSYSTQGRQPEVPGNVSLHAGWFSASLDAFLHEHPEPVALVHLDCDLYSSTRDVLQGLQDRLQAGTVLVFDELLAYPGYEQHELRAWQECMRDWPGSFRVIGASFMGRAVAFQLTA